MRRRTALLRFLLPILAAAILVACVSLQWEPRGPRRTAEIPNADIVGSEECGTCHEDVQGHEKIAAYHAGCESCHGGGSLHADSEAPEHIRYPGNEDCLACHAVARNTHLSWGQGEHSRAGLFCSDCHNPHDIGKQHLRAPTGAGLHTSFPNMDTPSGLCVGCHEDIGMHLRLPSHHPVGEGAMSCLSCHDPHEDRRVSFGDRNQLCAQCHQDIVGPWTFEHAPVAEDCSLCHNPHGAVSDNLLETIQPVICLSCHPVNDQDHHSPFATGEEIAIDDMFTIREGRTFLDRCTDCHGAIHGSYTDEHLRH